LFLGSGNAIRGRELNGNAARLMDTFLRIRCDSPGYHREFP